jgi:DNA-directed RNA polymerase subunit RPC12/RpoP
VTGVPTIGSSVVSYAVFSYKPWAGWWLSEAADPEQFRSSGMVRCYRCGTAFGSVHTNGELFLSAEWRLGSHGLYLPRQIQRAHRYGHKSEEHDMRLPRQLWACPAAIICPTCGSKQVVDHHQLDWKRLSATYDEWALYRPKKIRPLREILASRQESTH